MNFHNPSHVISREAIKDDRLIETVQKLWPEVRTYSIVHIAFCITRIRAFRQLAERLCPKVGRQDNQRLLEVHRATLTIGQHSIIEHLQEHVEHIWMRFFHLVKEHDLIRAAPHCFGQYAALIVAHIAGRSTNETRDRMFLHELGHINAHHRTVVIKEKFRYCFRQLSFPDTCWPKKQERTQRTILVIQTSTRATHSIRNRSYRRMLTNHTPMQRIFHSQQLVTLALKHL